MLIVGGAIILIGVLPFLSGLVGALILFAVTHRAHERLARVVPRRISAFAIAIGVVGMLLVAGTWLVSTIVSEGSDAIRGWRPDQAMAWLARTPLAGFDVTNEVAGVATALLGWLSSRAATLVGGATSLILNVVLALLGLYYLLLDAAPLWARFKRLLAVSDDVADLLAARFATVTDALLLGTVLTAVLQGTVVGGAFAIVGLHPVRALGIRHGLRLGVPALRERHRLAARRHCLALQSSPRRGTAPRGDRSGACVEPRQPRSAARLPARLRAFTQW